MRFDKFYESVVYITEEGDIQDWLGYINRIPMLKKGVEIIRRIENEGGKDARAYIVGGAIRDIITGEKSPDDIDIATNLTPDQVEKIFGVSHDIGKNKDFGIAIVTLDGEDFEVATFRQDGKYSDGRRPDDVKVVQDFETDAGRRDFTINAMGVDADGNIIDFFDGQKDIQDKVIKTVGDPKKRFGEDYLRMLRAVRFGSRLGFDISDETKKAIQQTASKIKDIAPERIFKELKKMADQEGSKFADAIEALDDVGLLQHILPEIIKMKDMPHSPEHHPEGGVWEHTLAALRSNKIKDPVVNLGVLFHDLGKTKTHTVDDGKHRYIDHAKKVDRLIDQIADRLKLSNEVRHKLMFAAVNHMKMHELLKMKNSKIAQLMADDGFDILVAVAEADAKARGDLFDDVQWKAITAKIDELAERYKDKSARDTIKKIVNGRLVMQLRGITKPGPEIGEVINQTVDWILDNSIDLNDTKQIEDYIKKV